MYFLNLPQLNSSDDIEKEVRNQISRIKGLKDASKEKHILSLHEKFISNLSDNVGSNEDIVKYEADKAIVLKKFTDKVEQNYLKRSKHLKYLTTINDLINFIVSSGENSKSNYSYVEQENTNYILNIKTGYVNNFVRDSCPLLKVLKHDSQHGEPKNLLKKFLIVDLIKNKIIDEILFEGSKHEKFEQKSVLFFEKSDKGYDMKLVYKETYRKYILCGVNNHEFVLDNSFLKNEIIVELRRIARTNSTFNIEGIRFNTFYLIKLLNSLEND